MRYIVYIDRLFLLQLVQSCVLLLLTREFLRSTVTLKRIVFASAAGTLLFCVIFLLSGISRNIKVLLFALCSLATLWLAFRIRTLQVFCRAVILYHAAAFLLAGALYALLHAAGRRPAMTTMQASLCAVGIGTAALYILRWEKKSAQAVIVTAILARWRRKNHPGGADRQRQQPVRPHQPKAGMRCGKSGAGRENPPSDIPEKFRLIPYHSLGKKARHNAGSGN